MQRQATTPMGVRGGPTHAHWPLIHVVAIPGLAHAHWPARHVVAIRVNTRGWEEAAIFAALRPRPHQWHVSEQGHVPRAGQSSPAPPKG